jgi:hypothetical protein
MFIYGGFEPPLSRLPHPAAKPLDLAIQREQSITSGGR